MKKIIIGLIVVVSSALMPVCHAQDTNLFLLPPTKIEAIQTNIGRVIIKASAQIGIVSAQAGELSVSYRQITDLSTGKSEYGISIGIATANRQSDNLIDYDELDSLLNAIGLLAKVDWSITSLPALDAFYVTKDGFRMGAFSSNRTAAMEMAVRNLRWNVGPVLLSRTEVARLRTLIAQSKSKLDELRAAK